MVRKMHPTLLLPILFHFVTLLAVVSVRVLSMSSPFSELGFVTHATTRQFVNADASIPRSLHPSRLRHLRFLERDVIPDLPAGWTSVGCYTLVFAQSLQKIRSSDFVTN
jgi:hypothetical protein